jgi:hypothetical protein
VDPVPDPLLLRKSCSAGNRTTLLRKCLETIPLHFFNTANFSFPSLPFRITDISMFFIVQFYGYYNFCSFS